MSSKEDLRFKRWGDHSPVGESQFRPMEVTGLPYATISSPEFMARKQGEFRHLYTPEEEEEEKSFFRVCEYSTVTPTYRGLPAGPHTPHSSHYVEGSVVPDGSLTITAPAKPQDPPRPLKVRRTDQRYYRTTGWISANKKYVVTWPSSRERGYHSPSVWTPKSGNLPAGYSGEPDAPVGTYTAYYYYLRGSIRSVTVGFLTYAASAPPCVWVNGSRIDIPWHRVERGETGGNIVILGAGVERTDDGALLKILIGYLDVEYSTTNPSPTRYLVHNLRTRTWGVYSFFGTPLESDFHPSATGRWTFSPDGKRVAIDYTSVSGIHSSHRVPEGDRLPDYPYDPDDPKASLPEAPRRPAVTEDIYARIVSAAAKGDGVTDFVQRSLRRAYHYMYGGYIALSNSFEQLSGVDWDGEALVTLPVEVTNDKLSGQSQWVEFPMSYAAWGILAKVQRTTGRVGAGGRKYPDRSELIITHHGTEVYSTTVDQGEIVVDPAIDLKKGVALISVYALMTEDWWLPIPAHQLALFLLYPDGTRVDVPTTPNTLYTGVTAVVSETDAR